MRGLRLSLQAHVLFRTQIRAIIVRNARCQLLRGASQIGDGDRRFQNDINRWPFEEPP
jgi:hypothetical protein